MQVSSIDLLQPRAWHWVPVVAWAARFGSAEALCSGTPWIPRGLLNIALGALSDETPAACLHAAEVVLAGGTIPASEPWSFAAGPAALLVVVAQRAPQSFILGAGLLAHARADEAEADVMVAELQRRADGDWFLVRHPGLLRFEAGPAVSNDASSDKRFATARARAALNGIVLTTTEADNGATVYIATQGAWLREFRAIDELEAWLGRVEGRA